MQGRRCVVEGCERFARAGSAVCRRHRGTARGREVERAVRRVAAMTERAAREDGGRGREVAKERFRQGIAAGEYAGLFEEPLRKVLHEAAAERGLEDELGALRVVLARLLMEEEDLGRQAVGVARVASAAVRVARARHELETGQGDALLDELLRVLEEEDGEVGSRQ